MGRFGKKNEIKIDPLKYNICLLGEPKIGKTTIVKEVLETLTGEEGYIFMEMAGEAGADAIQGIVFEDCDEWGDVDEIVDDIIENKTTEYPSLKAVVVDTFDGWIKLAQEEAIRLWNKDHPDKRADTIDASWNGFQKGQAKAFELMFDVMTRLRKVGVATIIIGHVKSREVSDVATGTTYQTLTSDVEKVYFSLLKKKMHFLGLAYYDRTIVTEKTGKKNIVTKKEETRNKLVSEARKIKFRDDNMAVDSGSRFAGIVEEIDFSAAELIKAMEDAIRAEASKGVKSIDELEAEQKKAEEKRLKEIAAAEDSKRNEKELKSVIDQINNYIKDNKKNMELIKPILAKCKEVGAAKPGDITDINTAKEILKIFS